MTPCIDGETLAAWSAGGLRAAEAAAVERHLADCARCQTMAAVFIRSEPPPLPAPTWWQSRQLRWLVPIATAGLVAAVWVAIPGRDSTLLQPAPVQSEVPAAPADTQSPAAAPGAGAAASQPQSPPPAVERFNSAPSLKAEAPQSRVEARSDAREEREADTAAPSALRREAAAPAAAAPAEPGALQESVRVMPENAPPIDTRSVIVEISSPKQTERWRVIAGRVEHSTTAGARWDPVDVPSNVVWTGHSPSASLAWLVGRQGAIFVTTDGATFERIPFPEALDLTRVVAVDGRQATVTAADGRTFQTTDRGVSWSMQEKPNAPF